MSRTALHRTLGTAVLSLALLATTAVTPSAAQTDTAARGNTSTAPAEDDGFDMGLLGLLGLAGLLGMRRREPVVTRVDRVDTTASTRPRV
jgi:hypothetical protein